MDGLIPIVVSPMDVATCWDRLKSTDIGRVGITIRALPVILPVFFCVVDDSVVFRCEPGTGLAAATRGAVIAFEADGYRANTQEGWSVVLQGWAREVTDPVEAEFLGALPVGPLGDGVRSVEHLIALRAASISGRWIEPARG